jgi:hypothetical protein
VPASYVASLTARTSVWMRAGAATEPCESILDGVIAAVEDHLDFRLNSQLHVVIYASNLEAQAALGRPVPPSMLLAPFQTAGECVVAVQSSAADVSNGDLARMRRHLAHEFAHVAVALRTCSQKRLGDEDRGMRVQPWVNEGFACVVAAMLCGRPDILDRELVRPADVRVTDLNVALNDLLAMNRSVAFAVATARVWRAVRAFGLRAVFATLDQPEVWQEAATAVIRALQRSKPTTFSSEDL